MQNREKAMQLYKMITPIEHSKTKEDADKYKVEPYVIAADVYGAKNLAGRGGWTWYTGSSGWYYIAGIEYILGLKIKEGYMSIKPCIPESWDKFSIRFKFGESIYNINVKNRKTDFEKIKINGEECETKIKLDDSGKIYNIEV